MNPLPTADLTLAIAYVRTSSAEQGRAYGPEVQRREIRAYAKSNGLRIVGEVREDVSGTTPVEDRPGMQDAMALAYRHGAGTLLLSERSRLARDERVAFDAEHALAASRLRVLYAQGTNGDDDAAKLAGGFEHLFAAYDRRRIVARLKAGRDAKAAANPHARAQGGKLPYGYRRTANGVELDPATAPHVVRGFELVRDGESIAKAAAILSEETDHAWTAKVLDRMLRRDLYMRKQPQRIVSPALFHATEAAMASRRKRAA